MGNKGKDTVMTVAIITVSDRGSRGERKDATGDLLQKRLAREGFEVVARLMVPDEGHAIEKALEKMIDGERIALVITNGGTGVAPRDVTPEATLRVIEREVPGMAEAMRMASLAKTPHAMLSRAVVGIRKESLVVNLPGSPKGALENLEAVLPAIPHALSKIQGDLTECATPLSS